MNKQQECNRLVLDGASDAEISNLLDVPHTTVERWRRTVEQRARERAKPKRRRKPLTNGQQAVNQLKREGFSMDKIKQVFGAVLVALTLAASTFAQQHTPADPVVQGDTVTIDGSICWHDAGIDSMVMQGSTMGLPGIYSTAGGTDPIRLRMPPGTHTITVLGYPDAGTNLRASIEQTVTIGQPTRVAQLVEAYRRLFSAQEAWRAAHTAIESIAPTREEVIEALGVAFGGT